MSKSISDIQYGPVSLGNNRLALDLDVYNSLGPAEQKEFQQELVRIIDKEFDLPEEQKTQLEERLQNILSGYEKNNHNASVLALTSSEEYGLVNGDLKDALVAIAFFKNSQITPETFIASGLGFSSEEDVERKLGVTYNDSEKHLHIEFVQEHEAGHFMHGLSEPGADLYSAAKLLQRYPDNTDVRDLLTKHADFRAVQSMFFSDARAGNKYGVANHESIMQMLTMPPEELARLSEEEIVSLARDQDKRADSMRWWNNESGYKEPAFVVKDALQAKIKQELGLSEDVKDLSLPAVLENMTMSQLNTIIKDLMDSPEVPETSAEWQILESLEESLNRMSAKGQSTISTDLDYQSVPGYSA